MADFTIRKGDRLPPIQAQLLDGETPVTLTGATIELRYRPKGGSTVITKTGAIVDALTGTVKYEWGVGDTDTIGVYDAAWRATFPDARKASYPNVGFFTIAVTEDL